MTKKKAFYLILSVLEGILSGGYFYLGQRDREPLHLATGCVFLVSSFFHGLLSIQEPEDDIIVLEEVEDE